MSMLEAAAAIGADVLSGGELDFDGIGVDSRRLSGGELFFALAGEQADGHAFLADAARAGARGAVVSEPETARRVLARDDVPCSGESDFALLQVSDTYTALHDLTRAARQRAPRHLVGITGSAGKTSTKTMLAAMLAQRFRTAASPGNLNNLYGFPVSLLSIPSDTEWMVAEMGMSTPGELGGVSRLAEPEVALFLNVRAAHLEGFESEGSGVAGLEHIANAKAELLEGLTPDGLAVFNAADRHVVSIGERHLASGGRVLGFALEAQIADQRFPRPLEVRHCQTAVAVGEVLGSRFELRVRSEAEKLIDRNLAAEARSAEVELPLHGRVNVENFLAAATCAFVLGVDVEAIARSARTLSAEPGRGQLLELGGATVIDDTYNSNPSALRSALEAAREIAPERRHWAVLGEMRELGRSSAELHAEAGRQAARCDQQLVIGIGAEAKPLVAGAERAGARTAWFAEATQAIDQVRRELQPGDVLLIKGSRGVRLERLIEALRSAVEEQG